MHLVVRNNRKVHGQAKQTFKYTHNSIPALSSHAYKNWASLRHSNFCFFPRSLLHACGHPALRHCWSSTAGTEKPCKSFLIVPAKQNYLADEPKAEAGELASEEVREGMLFVDNRLAHPKDISLARHLRVMFLPTNAANQLQASAPE